MLRSSRSVRSGAPRCLAVPAVTGRQRGATAAGRGRRVRRPLRTDRRGQRAARGVRALRRLVWRRGLLAGRRRGPSHLSRRLPLGRLPIGRLQGALRPGPRSLPARHQLRSLPFGLRRLPLRPGRGQHLPRRLRPGLPAARQVRAALRPHRRWLRLLAELRRLHWPVWQRPVRARGRRGRVGSSAGDERKLPGGLPAPRLRFRWLRRPVWRGGRRLRPDGRLWSLPGRSAVPEPQRAVRTQARRESPELPLGVRGRLRQWHLRKPRRAPAVPQRLS